MLLKFFNHLFQLCIYQFKKSRDPPLSPENSGKAEKDWCIVQVNSWSLNAYIDRANPPSFTILPLYYQFLLSLNPQYNEVVRLEKTFHAELLQGKIELSSSQEIVLKFSPSRNCKLCNEMQFALKWRRKQEQAIDVCHAFHSVLFIRLFLFCFKIIIVRCLLEYGRFVCKNNRDCILLPGTFLLKYHHNGSCFYETALIIMLVHGEESYT